jgi:flagellar protein FlgJ
MSDPIDLTNIISANSAITRLQRETAASAQKPPQNDEQLFKVCQEFEEILLKTILKEAHIERGLMGGEDSSHLYKEMTLESLAKSLSEGGGIGLAETLYRQLSNQHDNHQDPIQTTNSESVKIEGGE